MYLQFRRSGGKRRRHSTLSSVEARTRHQRVMETEALNQSQQQGSINGSKMSRTSEVLDAVYLANLKRELHEQGGIDRCRLGLKITVLMSSY